MMNWHNKLKFWWSDELGCYDLQVKDQTATVADYETTVGSLLEDTHAVRKYQDQCIGCSICCGGRLPLTILDVYRLQAGGVGKELPIEGWVKEYAALGKKGEWIDVGLSLDAYETCTLWDREEGLCRAYHSRPLICSTYICADISWRASDLRGQIVNTGEDELVDLLNKIEENTISKKRNPFKGKNSYKEILLKDICSARLWTALTKI
jgi:Fe-S-cluster containining protein